MGRVVSESIQPLRCTKSVVPREHSAADRTCKQDMVHQKGMVQKFVYQFMQAKWAGRVLCKLLLSSGHVRVQHAIRWRERFMPGIMQWHGQTDSPDLSHNKAKKVRRLPTWQRAITCGMMETGILSLRTEGAVPPFAPEVPIANRYEALGKEGK